ncbi:MAG TPA: ester cyclase [Acidimicrobiales bacterium]|nr:ester cyclase [Acidimicrobiales bacterium]
MSGDDRRLAIVEEHVRLENGHDFPACLAVFDHARYEVVPTGEVFDGAEAVDGFLEQNRRAFPDFVFVTTRIAAAGDAVLVEGRFTGTQLGFWRGLPPTRRPVDFAMAIVFDFEGDRMVCERVYFDLGAPLRQLGVAEEPFSLRGKVTLVLTHPVVVFRAFVRGLPLRIRRR